MIVDRCETRFGILDLKFDPDRGSLLNGKAIKVKGTCNHQDHAGVGVALRDALLDFRVCKPQETGCNAIGASHNPPTPELPNACDELGMLVLDETRMLSSNPEGGPVRVRGSPGPQSSQRFHLVDAQLGVRFGHGDRPEDSDLDESRGP